MSVFHFSQRALTAKSQFIHSLLNATAARHKAKPYKSQCAYGWRSLHADYDVDDKQTNVNDGVMSTINVNDVKVGSGMMHSVEPHTSTRAIFSVNFRDAIIVSVCSPFAIARDADTFTVQIINGIICVRKRKLCAAAVTSKSISMALLSALCHLVTSVCR